MRSVSLAFHVFDEMTIYFDLSSAPVVYPILPTKGEMGNCSSFGKEIFEPLNLFENDFGFIRDGSETQSA